MAKSDRRVKRTHKLLQTALIELIAERGYDALTVQEIVERANVGRTTFYDHYNSKDDLFLSCHDNVVSEFYPFHSQAESLLLPEPSPEMVAAYQHLIDARILLYPIFTGEESMLILRRIRDRSARELILSLGSTYSESDSNIPLDLLANYLAGAQIALVQWWLEKRQPFTAKDLAQTFHRLRRAAILDAFNLTIKE